MDVLSRYNCSAATQFRNSSTAVLRLCNNNSSSDDDKDKINSNKTKRQTRQLDPIFFAAAIVR
jgi:hypothetical protein